MDYIISVFDYIEEHRKMRALFLTLLVIGLTYNVSMSFLNHYESDLSQYLLEVLNMELATGYGEISSFTSV